MLQLLSNLATYLRACIFIHVQDKGRSQQMNGMKLAIFKLAILEKGAKFRTLDHQTRKKLKGSVNTTCVEK